MKDDFYTRLPLVEKPVSRIFFGTAFGSFMMGREQNELLDSMLGAGITAFDTAHNYLGAETSLGKWIEKSDNREKIVLLTKCAHPSIFGRSRVNEREIKSDLNRSLQQLHTEYVDIFLLHRDDPSVPAGEIVEVLNELHEKGKIRAFGGSNWRYERIAEANEYADKHGLIPFAVSSPNYGLAEQIGDPWGGGCESITGSSHKGDRDWYRNTQMPVIAYSSLARGLFSGRLKSDDLSDIDNVLDDAGKKGYACEENFERLRRCEELAERKQVNVAQIAMAWIFRQDINAFAIVSTKSIERMRENINAYELNLTPEECKYLNLEVNAL